jgi:hypothetical protein
VQIQMHACAYVDSDADPVLVAQTFCITLQVLPCSSHGLRYGLVSVSFAIVALSSTLTIHDGLLVHYQWAGTKETLHIHQVAR